MWSQTVVGVVGDVRQWGLAYRPLSEMYSHYAAGGWQQIYVTLKTTADPATLVPAVRARVLDVNPEQPVSESRTMEQIIATSLEGRSFFAFMTGITGQPYEEAVPAQHEHQTRAR